MKIESLNQSQAIYSKLCEIDSQLMELNKQAVKLSEKEQTINFTIDFGGQKQMDRLQSPMLDMYRSIMQEAQVWPPQPPAAPKNEFTFSEIEALVLIGSIVSIKKEQRAKLIDQLKELGFNL